MTKQEPTIDLLKSYIRKCDESLESTTDYALLGALDRRIELLRYAIECIEKQIPKKPIEKGSNFPNHLIVSCPECCHSFGVFIRDDKMSKITTYRSAKFNAWCPSCGNKLDWSDNE